MSNFYTVMSKEMQSRSDSYLEKILDKLDIPDARIESGAIIYDEYKKILEIKEKLSYDAPWSKSGNGNLFVLVHGVHNKKQFNEKGRPKRLDIKAIAEYANQAYKSRSSIDQRNQMKQDGKQLAKNHLKRLGLVSDDWYDTRGRKNGVRYEATYKFVENDVKAAVEISAIIPINKIEQVLDFLRGVAYD